MSHPVFYMMGGFALAALIFVNMSEFVFGSERRANMMMLGNSRMLVGRK